MKNKKTISIVTACFNEEDNVEELYKQVKNVFRKLPGYEYEHLFIDNSSTDNTVKILKNIASNDVNVKIIVNIKNYGHIRSPFHGLLQAKGNAIISIVADRQDPVDLIPVFIKKWEDGAKIVIGVKKQSKENFIMSSTRKLYYSLLKKMAETDVIKNFTGFGLYDQSFIDLLKELDDPYPYFRGLVSELGYKIEKVAYTQPKREKGKTNNNLYTLFDMAMLGFTSHTKIPLRIATFLGLVIGVISFILSIFYLVMKLLYWQAFSLGVAPILISLFFLSSVQFIFLGLLGEYIMAIHTNNKKRPLVIEAERINFETIKKYKYHHDTKRSNKQETLID